MGSEARTRLALAALLAVTLFSFTQLFADGEYPGPVALGMLLAGGIAVLCRRFGISSLFTWILSLAALAFYLAFVFQTRKTFYGLPTAAAFDGLADAVRRAVERSEIDYAPIPVRQGYVVLVVIGMWVAATMGEVATFRWRRPLIAAAPALVMFSVVMVVGTGNGTPFYVALFLAALLTYWGTEASHRLRSWGRWIPTWADRQPEEEEPGSVTGTIARKMGATTVAVALIAPIFLPALGDGLLSWRNAVGEGGPGTGSGRIDPLVSIAPQLINQTDRQLFTVRSETSTYQRLITLDEFDGETWDTSGGQKAEVLDGEIRGPAPRTGFGRAIEQTISLTGLESTSIPAAVQATEIELMSQESIEDSLRYDVTTGDVSSDLDLGGQLVYRVTSEVPTATYNELVGAEIGDPLDDVFFELPQELSPEVKTLLTEWTADAETPFEKLVAIQDNFRSGVFRYSLNLDELTSSQQASTDHLTNFLINTRTGYCQQFSTAFAVLARELGYPSRLVVGFLPGEASGREDEYLIRGTDAHSWPEVYFEGFGWVAFEPTPRVDSSRTAVAPDYTSPQGGGQSGPLGSDGTNAGGDGEGGAAGNEFLDARTQTDPGGSNAGLSALELQELRGGGNQGGAERPQQPWERTFGRISLVAIAALLLFLVAVPTLKEWRIRSAYRKAADGRGLAIAAFSDFTVNARELVTPRSLAETPTAYALRVASLKGIPERAAVELARIYEAAEYSPRDVSAEEADSARTIARNLRKNMWARSGLWQRATRLFSPRGFSGRRAVSE